MKKLNKKQRNLLYKKAYEFLLKHQSQGKVHVGLCYSLTIISEYLKCPINAYYYSLKYFPEFMLFSKPNRLAFTWKDNISIFEEKPIYRQIILEFCINMTN